MQFTELLPRQAKIADKFTVLRSMRQQAAGGHPAGSMQLLSGDPDTRDKPKPAARLDVGRQLPAFASRTPDKPAARLCRRQPTTEYNGPAYLGDAYSPFIVTGDPNAPNFTVPNIGLPIGQRSSDWIVESRCARISIRSSVRSMCKANLTRSISLRHRR